MSELVIDHLVKSFGLVRAVDDVSLTVHDGEFLTLLGPSGCGKSTMLGAIAGLDRPDSGRIALGDRTFFDGAGGIFVPPEKRDIGLVFQSYAIWPHMTVRRNVEFPLVLRSVPRAERNRRVDEVLSLVEMEAYADRYPHALSGGQQQRVALARTLVYRPPLLLLDEPLSNLDAKLRERARLWLRELQSKIRVTTVYVTHDQSEALDLSDRIAVVNGGRIVQLADPLTIYSEPGDAFVADFIGSANIFRGRVMEQRHGGLRLDIGVGHPLVVDSGVAADNGTDVMIAVRPERIEVVSRELADAATTNVFAVNVEQQSFLGARHLVSARINELLLRIESDTALGSDQAFVRIPNDACSVFIVK